MRATNKRYILIFILISIVIKLVFLFVSGVYETPVTFEYERMATNLLAGNGFYYEHFNTRYYAGHSPGYASICYIIYRLFGHNTLWVVFFQIVTTSLIALPIFFIARRVFDEGVALLASLLCALEPQFVIYATSRLHSINAYALIFTFLVLTFLRLKELPNLKNILLTGLTAGLALLLRMTCLGFVLLGIIWFYITARCNARTKAKAAFVIITVIFLMMLPWGIRNYLVFGKPLFFQTNKWESLWYGNMPGAEGSLFTESGETLYKSAKSTLSPEYFEMDEIKQGKYLKDVVIGYFRDDPAGFIKRILKKIVYFWYFSPYQGSQYPRLWLTLYKIYYLAIFLPALFSIIYSMGSLAGADRAAIALILLLFIALTGVHALYFLEGRHRWAVESLLLIFTAHGLMTCRRYVVKKTRI